MASKGNLLYVTLDDGRKEGTSTIDIPAWVKEHSSYGQMTNTMDAYIYRATDITESTPEKTTWLAMWESKDDLSLTIGFEDTMETIPAPGSVHRTDVFSLQSTYAAPSFSSTDLCKDGATNLIVAVIITLDAALQPEYDRYYETEHIHALMKVPGWRRTRRFVELTYDRDVDKMVMRKADGEVKILQLHDYDPENYGVGGTEFKQATGTEWYKEMMKNAVKAKDRRTYELVGSLEC